VSNCRSTHCRGRSRRTAGFCPGSLSDPPRIGNLCWLCFMKLCEWLQVYRISAVAALGRAARNSTIKTDHLSKDGKPRGPPRVRRVIAVISVTTERNALQGETWLQNLAHRSHPAARRGRPRDRRRSAAQEAPSPPADWGKNHKNIFHMQAAVNKPVKYLQACQGICNGDHSVASECKSCCLGRQSREGDAPGLLLSPRADPATRLCRQRPCSGAPGRPDSCSNKPLHVRTGRLRLPRLLYFSLMVLPNSRRPPLWKKKW